MSGSSSSRIAAGTGGGVELTRGTLLREGGEGSWTLGSDGPSGGPADAWGAAGFGGSSDILPRQRSAETWTNGTD